MEQRGFDAISAVGVLLLVLSLPLLIWQAFPHNQVAFSAAGFLVVHSLMEIFAVVVAALIFFIVYGARDTGRTLRAVVLGYAFLAVAVFDVLHLLSYAGMPDTITPNSPHKSILFWLCARVAGVLGLLAYILLPPLEVRRESLYRWGALATLLAVMMVGLSILIWPGQPPAMYVPGEGLTPTKVAMEWLVVSLYLLAAGLLWWRRERLAGCDTHSLLLALLLMAAGELFFTVYVEVSSTANLLGHTYKVIAFYFLYRAIFAEAVRRPFMRIRHMLSHDELTGLHSWSAFNERLQQVIDESRAHGYACAVILLGLDNFKTVNATLGHEQGDQLLRAVAQRISAALPPSVFIARFSGDTFVLLLARSNARQAQQAGQALLHAMREEFDLGEDHIAVGASLGMVLFPRDGEDVSALLRHADVALQRAKADGRHRQVVFSPELGEAILRRARVEFGLRYALARGELSLHYQPKVALADGRIIGWEALLRWDSRELGAVSPAEFIPVAEESGLILTIGDWVLQQGCRQMVAWQAAGLAGGALAVNLSTRQFRQNDLPERVEAILRDTGLPPQLLDLEITESIIMDNPASAAEMMTKLVRLGVHIHIDDFGTGHSSLSYLKTFPIHSLKIDRSFIRDIPGDENDVAIVHAILGLGHSLGLEVVAEGVETEAQLAYLKQEGCDVLQGYLFSRPLPAQEAEALLRSGTSQNPLWARS